MIGALAVLLQLAVTTPSILSVRSAAGEAGVPLVETNIGMALEVDRLAPLVPVDVRADDAGRYHVDVVGVQLDITDQVPFIRVNGDVVPLASAPFVANGRLHVPFEVVTDVLPRAAAGKLRYDPARAELRLLGGDATVVAGAPAAATTSKRATPSRSRSRTTRRRVVVDAGHGGPDHGMSGPIGTKWTIYEKDITLSVAKKLEAALRERGVDVIMTRSTDTLIALSDRGRIANEQHGDVFVSIHVNAANLAWHHPADARGYETYFLAEAKTEDAKRVERMENESVHFETDAESERDDPLTFIKNDMAQNEHLRESNELAAIIQHHLGAISPGPSRGVKQAGFRVLVTAFMPAVLVEIGFGTNVDEARYLTEASKQRQIATAVAEATMEYLDHYERRLGASTP